MKKVLVLLVLTGAFITSCNRNSAEDEKYMDETLEMDSISQEIEQSTEELQMELEEDLNEVDSLLKDI